MAFKVTEKPVLAEKKVWGRAPVLDRYRPLAPYLFLLPGLIFVAVWVYWPLVQTLWFSFFDGSLVTGPSNFVGLHNYQNVLALTDFQQSLVNTGLYIVGLMFLTVFLPLLLALLLVRVPSHWRTLYQSILFMPTIVAPIVVSLIWSWILNPVQGVLNQTLYHLFQWIAPNWLTDPGTALWTIVWITGWNVSGLNLLLLLTALLGDNRLYVDAARLDGATEWQVTRFITLPLLRPTLSFLALYTILFAGQWSFGPINVLTQGGPGTATSNIYFSLYQFGFVFFNTGHASAIAVLLFLFLGIGLVIVLRVLTWRISYES